MRGGREPASKLHARRRAIGRTLRALTFGRSPIGRGKQKLIKPRANLSLIRFNLRLHAELYWRVNFAVLAHQHEHWKSDAISELHENHLGVIAQDGETDAALSRVALQKRVRGFLRPFDADPEKLYRFAAVLVEHFVECA